MLRIAILGAAVAVALTSAASAQSPEVKAVQQACRADAMSLCSGVPRGQKMLQCLQQNQAQLSAPCQQALAALTASQQ